MLELNVFISAFRYNKTNRCLYNRQNGLPYGITIYYQPNGSIDWLKHWYHGMKCVFAIGWHDDGSMHWLKYDLELNSSRGQTSWAKHEVYMINSKITISYRSDSSISWLIYRCDDSKRSVTIDYYRDGSFSWLTHVWP